jgi:hypothetical protein
MGGGAELEKIAGSNEDTIIALAGMVDKIEGMSDEEKVFMQYGTLERKIKLADGQLTTKLSFSFTNIKEISALNKLTNKLIGSAMKDMMANLPMGDAGESIKGMGDMPDPSSFDDYFDVKFTDDKIERTINKEKYAKAASNEYLNGIKQASAMGIPVTSTLIINLPRPAEKVEGKNVKLSEDKMKVTVKTDIDDFFDYPEKLEFTVKF